MSKRDDANREQRFEASKITLFADKFMNVFICAGGIAVILTVMFIFVFILGEILPLFRGAEVEPMETVAAPAGSYISLGVDEWTERPFLVRDNGEVIFIDMKGGGEPRLAELPFLAETTITAVTYVPELQTLVYGTRDGHFYLVDINYTTSFTDNQRSVEPEIEIIGPFKLSDVEHPISYLDYGGGGEDKVLAAIVDTDDGKAVHVETLIQQTTLMGVGEMEPSNHYDLSGELPDTPVKVLVSGNGRNILVVDTTGQITYFLHQGGVIERKQVFRPFPVGTNIASADFLFGDSTLILSSTDGQLIGYSRFMHPTVGENLWSHTKTFRDLPAEAGADLYAKSLRNKGFLIGQGSHISLRYSTTETLRWETDLEYAPTFAAVSSKYDRIVILDDQSRFHIFALNDPHPEAGFAAYFNKLWYEDNAEAEFKWQSTGGSDASEAKLSMVPLVIGTLKGTIYALMFAVPIGLLAALYVSQFQKPKFKTYIKPTMEIMASLPSVVLGFLGALWLAPILETRVPTFLLFVLLLPLVALGFGIVWSQLPKKYRLVCPDGYEFIGFVPILFITWVVAWYGGPIFERLAFTVQVDGGRSVADFRLWWAQLLDRDNAFQQRNALVVGFMMGFAVIPIIFTITEDALSNVPKDLTGGAMALGASRWQTAFSVVLPTASAGIFSAIMIGLGRAVGETMIVLMATGNTPIMELNIFSGMRTLSANIAVELPEAPQDGTLYRTLFLGAFLLFLFTFIINTLAEVLRQHLRNKYKTV